MADMILILVRDLLLASRITSTAQGLGMPYRVVRDPQALTSEAGTLLVLDLEQPGTLDAAIAWKNRVGGRLLGFGSHVNTDTINKARQAGVDRVVPRSALMTSLPALLKSAIEEPT
jgi:hypothetical protein